MQRAYLYAGGELNLLAAQNSDYSLYDMKKKGSFGSKKTQRDEVTTVRNIGSTLTTGGDLTLASEGDQRYQNARLESGNDLTLDSGGAIAFEAVKDLDQESHEKSKSGALWQSAKGKGTTDETVQQSVLIAKGETVIRAVEGLQIDIKHVDQQTVSQTIDAMVQADPELAWLKEMEQRGDVDWRRVKEVHDSFKYSHSGLGGAAMIVIAIIVTYLTAGAASGMVAGAAGAGGASAGAAAGAAAAGTAAAGTAAASSSIWAAATATTAAGWANVAATAALTSAASGAAISTINNRGDLGAVLKDVTSSDALKGYFGSALTAGFTSGVLDSAFGVTGDNVNKVTKGFDLSKTGDIGKFGSYLGAQGAIQAVTQTALQGGSLSDNLQGALTGQVYHLMQAVAFNATGDLAQANTWQEGSPEKIALHAVVGGLLSEATGGDFRTGALAAGANELLIEQLSGMIKSDKNLELAVSQLIGVAAATATGGDPAKAAELAKNATAYNRQLHPDEIKFASDDERVKRYAEQTGISEDAARQELLRTAAAMVDRGWNESLSEQNGNTQQAASFLRAELAQNQSGLFQVTLADYNNERLGLKELFSDRDALNTLVSEVALVDPLAYKTDPKYFQEVLNAKGLGSQEGFGNAVEGATSGPSKVAMWLMGAANCPSCALEDIQNAWEAVSALPEELSYKAYLDNLHIMQGKGAEVVQQNAASSTELGVDIGLTVSPVLGGGVAKGNSVAGDFFAGTKYTDKVLGQIKTGDLHAFSESVKAFQEVGEITKITGGDGVVRDMLKIPGEYRGKQGVFEFIKEPDGSINHRLFKPSPGQ